jgi:hypothetical protein
LTNPTPLKAFIIGIVMTLPGASYVAGMDVLSKHHLGMAPRVGLVLLFNLIQLLIIEVPLVAYFISPNGADALVKHIRDFFSSEGRLIFLIAGTVVGVLLLTRGIVRLA